MEAGWGRVTLNEEKEDVRGGGEGLEEVYEEEAVGWARVTVEEREEEEEGVVARVTMYVTAVRVRCTPPWKALFCRWGTRASRLGSFFLTPLAVRMGVGGWESRKVAHHRPEIDAI